MMKRQSTVVETDGGKSIEMDVEEGSEEMRIRIEFDGHDSWGCRMRDSITVFVPLGSLRRLIEQAESRKKEE